MSESINVRDFGAKGDGVTDDTGAIQMAIDQASATNILNVWIPSGTYRITSLVLPQRVRLHGMGRWPWIDTGEPVPGRGTWLYCTSTSAPAITMQSSSTIRDVAFFYPNQVTSGTPIPYPATITAVSGATRMLIRDVAALNPYTFIDISQAHGLLTVQDVNAYPLNLGIRIDQSYDIDRIENVHFNPNIWMVLHDSNTLRQWVYLNATAFQIGRADWPRLINCFCFGYRHGFELTQLSGAGPSIHTTLLACGADSCYLPFLLRKGNMPILDSCEAVSLDERSTGVIGPAAVLIEDVDACSLHNVKVSGTQRHGIVISPNIAATRVSIRGCQVDQYGLASSPTANAYGIVVDRNTNGVIIDGNQVFGQFTPTVGGIIVGGISAVSNVVVTNNRISNMGLFGIALESASTGIVCTSNLLNQTGGLDDNAGQPKVVTNNIGTSS